MLVQAQHPETGNTILHILIQHRYLGAIRPLFDGLAFGKTALIGIQNYCGDTALHSAAQRGFVEVIELLLRVSGSSWRELINVRNDVGETALYCAAKNGYYKTVELLLRWGADGSICNSDGTSPAVIARYNGFSRIATLIEVSI